MEVVKTKSLKNIEQRMDNIDKDSVRYHILESARNFKVSWVDLGRALCSAWKDKLYKDWGYGTFEAYTAREIGIKKQTAMKLLKSYYFLEKEEPVYLKKDYDVARISKVPSYENINLLRLAKSKKGLDRNDYTALKKEIFEDGKDVSQVKKDLTAMIRQREELDPQEAREKRKIATLKRFIGTLKALKQEIETSKLVPAEIIKEAESLIKKLEKELN